MRRRIWCVVDTWDWQISSGLFRPSIIDHTNCTVDLPTLTLEDYSPSPLMHMKLQSDLIHRLAKRFASPRNINTPSEAQEYKDTIDKWMLNFPPAYALKNPDTSGDKSRPWITFHRYYIHTMGYMMLLNPIRSFMSATFTNDTAEDLLAIRAMGVDFSLRLIGVLQDWVDFVSYRDGRFHFIIFSLFDTAAVLSTAVIKDKDHTIPSRDRIYAAIDTSVSLLKQLMALSPTAKRSYDILWRIVRKMPRPAGNIREVALQQNKFDASETVARRPPPLAHPAAVEIPVQVPDQVQTSLYAPNATQPHQTLDPYTAPMFYAEPVYSQEYVDESALVGRYAVAGDLSATAVLPTPQAGVEDLQAASYSSAAESRPRSDSSIGSIPGGLLPSGMSDGLLPPKPLGEDAHDLGTENITDAQLGELGTLWNWQSLNLDFISSEAAASAQPDSMAMPPDFY